MANNYEGEIIPVKINGKEYRTALYNGVQRFVPNGAVNFIVNSLIEDGNPHGNLYNDIFMKFLEGEISLEDIIDFLSLCNGSLGHFEDSLSSLIDMNEHIFHKDYEELVVIENPLWND